MSEIIADGPDDTNLCFHLWEWSPAIAEIWDASGKYKRSQFSRFVADRPRQSGISAIVGKFWDSQETVKSPYLGFYRHMKTSLDDDDGGQQFS